MISVINAISHFLVDAVCVCALFSFKGEADILNSAVMLYDTFAFSTQCLVGLMLDNFAARKYRANAFAMHGMGSKRVIKNRCDQSACGGQLSSRLAVIRTNGYLEALSMMVVAAGALIPCGIILKAVIIGLGNSLFHVAGGFVTLKNSDGKAAPLGMFVAPGAFGVTLGTLYPSALVWVAAVLAAAAVVCFITYMRVCEKSLLLKRQGINRRSPEIKNQLHVATERSDVMLPVALLTAAVAVRAIGGCAAAFSWKDSALDAVLLTLFVFLGKFFGGFVCDRFGAAKMSAVTIPLAAVFTAFFALSMPLSLLGQFFLNLSMPVTLWLLYRHLPDYPGLAFGLAASALWPGMIAGLLINISGPPQSILILVCFIFGLGAIIYAERSYNNLIAE